MSTLGFLTVIVVPSFETSVGAFSTVGVSSVALAVASVEVASAVGASVFVVGVSAVGATVSVAGCVEVTGSVTGATASVAGCVADTSSAEALGAMIASRAAVKITPQRPNALDFTNPSLMFLFVIVK